MSPDAGLPVLGHRGQLARCLGQDQALTVRKPTAVRLEKMLTAMAAPATRWQRQAPRRRPCVHAPGRRPDLARTGASRDERRSHQ